MICQNERCKRGPGGTVAKLKIVKEWKKYCSRECGDAVRRLRYYYAHKEMKA